MPAPAAPAPLTRDAIGQLIAEKAWREPDFHRAILADPHAAIEQATGQPVPPGVTIKVVEDDAHTVHFVMPARPSQTGEVSDEELEQVAGGTVLMGAGGVSVSVGVSLNPPSIMPAVTVGQGSLVTVGVRATISAMPPNPGVKW